ncbi:MAG: hypothetical protein AB7T49_11015 [Oligoflexales bacterium]
MRFVVRLASLAILFLTTHCQKRRANSQMAGAHPVGPDACYSQHIEDAMRTNTTRKPIYEKLTGGKSTAVSDTLLYSESQLLTSAAQLDAAANPWRKAGVPVLCLDFVSMSHLPEFQEKVDAQLPDKYLPPMTEEEHAELSKTESIATIGEKADQMLQTLENGGTVHCMYRHVLETVRRSAQLTPYYREQALAKGLADTDSLMNSFVRFAVQSLAPAAKLDHLAFEVHKMDVPIICQDVPDIPPFTK